MGLGILLVHKVRVIGANKFYTIFFSQFYNHLISLLLQWECITVGTYRGVFYLVPLKFQIIILSEHPLVPFNGFTGPGDIILQYTGRHLTGNTCRTHDEAFVIFFQVFTVCTRAQVISVHPCMRDKFYEILISLIIFCQHDEVITAHVSMVLYLVALFMMRHIHLATENGFEWFLALCLELTVNAIAIIKKLLYTEHIAMVSDCHSAHTIANSLIHKFLNT